MMSIKLTQNLLAQFAAGFQAGAIVWGLAHLSMFLVHKAIQVQPAAVASLQEPVQLIAAEQPLSAHPDEPLAGEAALTVEIAPVLVALDQPAPCSLSVRQLRTIAKALAIPGSARLRFIDQKLVLSHLTALALAL